MMKRLLVILLSLGMTGLASALVISNSTISGITATSAVVRVQVVSTNGTGTNPVLTCYYDITDHGTNYAINTYTNAYGLAGEGTWAVSNQSLSAATKYYFRWRGVEGTNIALTTPSSNWWTSASLPTAAPPSGAYGNVSAVATSSVLKWPTNLFSVNSGLVIQAISGSFATGTPVYVETDSIATNLIYITSNAYVAADTVVRSELTNTITVGSNYFELVKLNTNGSGAGLTGITAAQVGSVATNDARYLAALTNETYLGTITGATITAGSADSITVTGPNAAITWNTNAVAGGGTSGDTNVVWGNITGTLANQLDLTSTVAKASSALQPAGNGALLTGVNATNATALGGVAAATWAGATNNLNTAVGSLNAATGSLNTAVGVRVQKSGDIMTGPLTNNVAYWLPVGGKIHFGTSTNFIQDLGGTNYLFQAGTNWAVFGW